jgi:hypothetical protein
MNNKMLLPKSRGESKHRRQQSLVGPMATATGALRLGPPVAAKHPTQNKIEIKLKIHHQAGALNFYNQFTAGL